MTKRDLILKITDVVKVVSGENDGDSLFINQAASIYRGKLSKDEEFTFKFKNKGYGAYLFVLEGSIILDDTTLNKRDAAGISDSDQFSIQICKASEFILIEIPMN